MICTQGFYANLIFFNLNEQSNQIWQLFSVFIISLKQSFPWWTFAPIAWIGLVRCCRSIGFVGTMLVTCCRCSVLRVSSILWSFVTACARRVLRSLIGVRSCIILRSLIRRSRWIFLRSLIGGRGCIFLRSLIWRSGCVFLRSLIRRSRCVFLRSLIGGRTVVRRTVVIQNDWARIAGFCESNSYWNGNRIYNTIAVPYPIMCDI